MILNLLSFDLEEFETSEDIITKFEAQAFHQMAKNGRQSYLPHNCPLAILLYKQTTSAKHFRPVYM